MISLSRPNTPNTDIASPHPSGSLICLLLSVLGIISIPGMMTGALLGGAPVAQAARLQMVIMFMIAASSALAAILVTGGALAVVVDGEHRVRAERVDARIHWVWRGRERLWGKVCAAGEGVKERACRVVRGKRGEEQEGESAHANGSGERRGLLG